MTCVRRQDDDPTQAKQFDTEEHRQYGPEFIVTDMIVSANAGDSHSELVMAGEIE